MDLWISYLLVNFYYLKCLRTGDYGKHIFIDLICLMGLIICRIENDGYILGTIIWSLIPAILSQHADKGNYINQTCKKGLLCIL